MPPPRATLSTLGNVFPKAFPSGEGGAKRRMRSPTPSPRASAAIKARSHPQRTLSDLASLGHLPRSESFRTEGKAFGGTGAELTTLPCDTPERGRRPIPHSHFRRRHGFKTQTEKPGCSALAHSDVKEARAHPPGAAHPEVDHRRDDRRRDSGPAGARAVAAV